MKFYLKRPLKVAILVFDLPGLFQCSSVTRIPHNNCHDNNRTNFAPFGNIVSHVPAGTESMILNPKNVEIFGNTLTNNNFTGVLVANDLFLNSNIIDPNFVSFPTGVYIHENPYGAMGTANTNQQTLTSRLIDPGNSKASSLLFRINSNKVDIRIPEIGRAWIHEEGVQLIAAWIDSL